MKYLLLAAILLLLAIAAIGQLVPKSTIEKKIINKIEEVAKKTDKSPDSLSPAKTTPQNPDQKNSNPAIPKTDTAVKPGATDQLSLQAYSQYDFVTGDSVLFFEDFSQDAIGDFPALWTTNKSGEVSTLNIAPGNWLNLNATEGNWWYLKVLHFPKNFILEFDVVPKKGAPRYAVGIVLYGEESFKEMSDPFTSKSALIVNIAKTSWDVYGHKAGMPRMQGNSVLNLVKEEKLNHVIIWVQNRRVRIYHGGAKVLDMPTVIYDESKFTRLGFALYRGASSSSYISNIKITTATPDTRSKLLTEGKLVTYGIYFDVNKDIVKPESYGTLKSIAQVLQESPGIRVKIVGHTDADGDDASNLDLSRRRAASVKNELLKTFGIEASRMETEGKGEAKPVAPNDKPSNKALNRRVEFIKL